LRKKIKTMRIAPSFQDARETPSSWKPGAIHKAT
jgi:hypothetical protein